MSLRLTCGTKPNGLSVKTVGVGIDTVFLGDYEISLKDFLFAAHYVLTNTNLEEGDPRLQFVESVRTMQVVKGYPVVVGGEGQETKRLRTEDRPVTNV